MDTAPAPRRRLRAVVVAAAAAGSVVWATDEPRGEEPAAVASVHQSLQLPFACHAAATAQEPPAEPAPEAAEEALEPPCQTVAEWLMDERRAAKAEARGPLAALVSEGVEAAVRKKKARVEEPQPLRRFALPRPVALVAQQPAPASFDFRAARADLPLGLTAACSERGRGRGRGKSESKANLAATPSWPFDKTSAAGVVEPFKGGLRSHSFPRSGNRVQTFK